jgi:acetyl esterase/lipase
VRNGNPSNYLLFTIIGTILLTLPGCSIKLTQSIKNITYLQPDSVDQKPAQRLNVFVPRKKRKPLDVFVFIHGGNWNSGKKSLYNVFGRKMAQRDIATVIIEYPLSPGANYHDMASAAATSVKWVKENIDKYGGNPEKIVVSGHSAGGHLAALITADNSYFDFLQIQNPIKGAVLIDAAGLDLPTYIQSREINEGHTYANTFSMNPENWKRASPLHHLHHNVPPMLIFEGGRSILGIKQSINSFRTSLNSFDANYTYIFQKRKKHVPMMTQFLNSWSPRYREIRKFMNEI